MSEFDAKKYISEYKREKLKRVPLDMQLSEYERVKASAAACGQPVNTYIKQAIKERQQRENGGTQNGGNEND